MLPNIFDLSGKGNSNESEFQEKADSDFSFNDKFKDELTAENMADTEKAENEIWQGIKSEKNENLELAAFHYRSAIKYDSECAKAYRLLSNVLKRIRETRSSKAVKVGAQPEIIDSAKVLDTPSQEEAAKLDGSQNAEAKKEMNNNDPERVKLVSRELTNALTPDFADKNPLSLEPNLSINNLNFLSPSKSEIVFLPNVELSPSGDLVLEDSLTVSQVYIEQALTFFEDQQWEKSIAACQEALRICSSLGEAYKIWGNCLQQSGNSGDAIGIYAKALELQPNMAEIYCNLGSISAKSKKWQQAIEFYQKSMIIDPNCAAPYRNLARVWDHLGEYEKSENCFFQALAIKPELISAKDHFSLAHNLAEENQPDKAIACYKNCINLEPNFLNAYVRLAQLLEQAGQTEAALYYYKKLAQLQTQAKNKDSQSKSRQQIHSLLFGQGKKQAIKSALPASIVLKEQKLQQSIPQLNPGNNLTSEAKITQYLQKAQQQPNSPSIQIELGNLYFLADEWQKAIAYYLKGIKLAPHEAKYYINLGKAWEKGGDQIKANQAFYQGFSLEPEKVTAQNHLLLGNKLVEQRQIKSAIACYRRAITLQPKLLEAYWQLGKILIGGGKYQVAIICYQQALKVDPKQAQSYFWLGNVYTQTQQWKAAFECYQKAGELEPNNADIHHNLGESLSQIEKWHDAIVAYQKAIAITPDNSWSHNNLGNALLKTEQWHQAANSFRRAIQLKPDFVWSHYNLAEALVALEQWDEALSEYQSAQRLEPNLPQIKQKIGAVLHRRSQESQKEASSFCQAQIKADPDNIELYHQAISLDRKNHQLYLGLGKALSKQGKLDEAISILQMGLAIQPQNLELASELSEAIQAKSPHLDRQDIAQIGGLINSYPSQS
jgi:O-antigen biosynthesis protein